MDALKGRDEVYSEKIRAGKRTYFFDVRSTRSNDYYITITESKRRFNGQGYDKHKIFLYKEDFNKFLVSLNQTVEHVKTVLMPDYDYEEFDREPIRSTDPPASTEGRIEEAGAVEADASVDNEEDLGMEGDDESTELSAVWDEDDED